MTNGPENALLEELRQVRQLLELLAEPAIAQRDAKLRAELREIVGASPKRQQAALLMDGSRTQAQISEQAGFHKGDLSAMVKKMKSSGLLIDSKKEPQLSILVPPNFFDANASTK